jgi:single-strand DNA-binding protein
MNPKITLVGRLGQDPEAVGTSGVKFRVVTSDRVKNDSGAWEDRDTSWWTVKAWKTLAQQATSTLKKGQEIMVTGTMSQDSWTDSSGQARTSYEITADSVGLTAYTLSKSNSTAPLAMASSTEDPWKK